MSIYEESTLWSRYVGISQEYSKELKNPELKATMSYLKYLIQRKYTGLTKAQKERIGHHLGLIEIQCKEQRKLNQKVIDIRINLCREMHLNVKV